MAKKTAADSAPRHLRVKQIKSGNGRPETHRRTLRALGLRHHQDIVQVVDNPAVRGMLFQVRHLVEVTDAEGEAPSTASSRARARKPVKGTAETEVK